MLIHGGKCKACSWYRRTLCVPHGRWCQRNGDELSSSSSHTNVQYFNTPEKVAKVAKLRNRVRCAESEVARLRETISKLMQSAEAVDKGLHQNLSSIMHDNTDDVHNAFPEGTFR